MSAESPEVIRLSPQLAAAIGLNESIVLLQLDYLMEISGNERDGRVWTYQTLGEMKEQWFPFLSVATLSRVLHSLKEQGLIDIDNHNKKKFDRTQWFTVNRENALKLPGFYIFQNEKSKQAKRKIEPIKMKNRSEQNETTIPKTPTEITTKITKDSSAAPTGARQRNEYSDEFCDAYEREGGYGLPYEPSVGDFVQLATLRRKGREWLTLERFRRGLTHYFASEMTGHTLADFCARFKVFYEHPIDRFKQPLNGGNSHVKLSPEERRLAEIAERRAREDEEVRGHGATQPLRLVAADATGREAEDDGGYVVGQAPPYPYASIR